MTRRLYIFLAALLSCVCVHAQEIKPEADTVTAPKPIVLETLQDTLAYLGKKRPINNYNLIGVTYGASFSQFIFNPPKFGLGWKFSPEYLSVTFTHHEKMFDYLPYFAFQIGAAYGHEGFFFPPDKDDPINTNNQDGATECDIRVVEIPAMAQIHVDMNMVKVLANIGFYGGYRLSIERSGPTMDMQYANKFRDYEVQFDYGLQGGAGIGFMFDPFEIHISALARYSWSSLYHPDYYSKIYYRFGTPLDIMATVGIHYQLTRRTGRSRGQLRKEAREIVSKRHAEQTSQDR